MTSAQGQRGDGGGADKGNGGQRKKPITLDISKMSMEVTCRTCNSNQHTTAQCPRNAPPVQPQVQVAQRGRGRSNNRGTGRGNYHHEQQPASGRGNAWNRGGSTNRDRHFNQSATNYPPAGGRQYGQGGQGYRNSRVGDTNHGGNRDRSTHNSGNRIRGNDGQEHGLTSQNQFYAGSQGNPADVREANVNLSQRQIPQPPDTPLPSQDAERIHNPKCQDSTLSAQQGKPSTEIQQMLNQRPNAKWFAPRPGYVHGKSEVRTNFFRLHIGKDKLLVYSMAVLGMNAAGGEVERQLKSSEQIKAIFRALLTSDSSSIKGKHWATDYVRIFSFDTLNPDENTESSENTDFPIPQLSYKKLNGDEEKVDIKIKLQGTVALDEFVSYCAGTLPLCDITDTETIKAINAIVAKDICMRYEEFTQVGLNRFFDNSKRYYLDSALIAKTGYFTSVRPGMAGPLLNVNVATTAFYRPILLSDFIKEILELTTAQLGVPLSGHKIRILRSLIKHLKVRIIYNREPTEKNPNINIEGHRLKRIADIGDPVNEQRYTPKDSLPGTAATESVLDFFQNEKQLKIKKPNLPCINVGNSDPEKPEHHVWIPPEYLQIEPNQVFRGKLNQNQTTNMLGVALRHPAANARLIEEEGLAHLGLAGSPASSSMQAFGLSIEPTMLKVPAHFFTIPDLQYRHATSDTKRFSVQVKKASWNIRSSRFFLSGSLPRLRVIHLQGGPNCAAPLNFVLDEFKRELAKYGLGTGDFATPLEIAHLDLRNLRDSRPSREAFVQTLRAKFAELEGAAGTSSVKAPVLMLIPSKDQWMYALIKRLADCELGIPTVCSITSKLSKRFGNAADLGYMANVAMKFNLRLKGTNHSLLQDQWGNMNFKQTMIVGADVSHSGVGSAQGTPSIAAVVATVDQRIGHYPGSMRLQAARQEFIEDLAVMVEERLLAWYGNSTNSKKFPRNILFYRDGVSESQYSKVRESEIQKVKNGCVAAGKKHQDGNPFGGGAQYMPKITFVVVGKRHNTRFFPVDSDGSYTDHDKKANQDVVNGNVKPGLGVDCGVTSPYFFDFYLQTHAAVKGTARPAHYIVFLNEMDCKTEDLQQFTTNLCYCYPRATKGVSYATPAYLADRLAERGRCYLKELLDNHWERDCSFEPKTTLDARMVGHVSADTKYWRSPATPLNSNPWHSNLNDVMFYL